MKIVGLNISGYHSSSCLVIDGEIASAITEERLTRKKRDRSFPFRAINYCLESQQLKLEEVDHFYVGWNPAHYLFKPQIDERVAFSERSLISHFALNSIYQMYNRESPIGFSHRIELSKEKSQTIKFVDHHLAHLYSCFSIYDGDSADFFIADGFGERSSGMLGTFEDPANPKSFNSFNSPHSLGSFYSTITQFCGFEPNGDEWKVMALSSMGDSNRFYDKLKTLLRTNDLAFELDLSYFEHYLAFTPFYFSQKFIDTFGLPVKKGESLEAHHLDLVSAAQRIVEECVIKILRNLHSITGKNSILLAGGFFMNSVLNGKVHEFTDYTEAYLGGSPDDSGVSLGSAIYGYMKESGGIRVKPRSKDNFFGRDYSKEEIARELVRRGIKFREVVESSKLAAQKISEGQVVAWFHGASEFGQRALGHRSILGDPRNPSMKDRINKKVKYRETFRPFAPSILENFVHEYFDVPPNQNSFFMEKVFRFKNEVIGIVPAVVHADGTGRLQSVNRESNMRYYNLIEEFRKITGVPLVLNTSLNTNGVPLVESPSDALDCFFDSGIDCIFIEDFLIEKEN